MAGSFQEYRKEKQKQRLQNEKERLMRLEGYLPEDFAEEKAETEPEPEPEPEPVIEDDEPVSTVKTRGETDMGFDPDTVEPKEQEKYIAALSDDSEFRNIISLLERGKAETESILGEKPGMGGDPGFSSRRRTGSQETDFRTGEKKEVEGERAAKAQKKSSRTENNRQTWPGRAAGSKEGSARTEKNKAKERRSTANRQERPARTRKPRVSEEEKRPAMSPQQKLRLQRLAIRAGLLLAGIVILCFAIWYFLTQRRYNDYRILASTEQVDTVSTEYLEFENHILRYSTNDVGLMNSSLQFLWTESYEMSNPIAAIRGKHAVIGDKDGTSLVILDESGVTGRVVTPYSIVKVCVSRNGLAAAILDGGEDTWINFYSADGRLIADNQTTIQDPGYPMDVALFDNGAIMMVAYQFIDGSDTTSYVAFYNFRDSGLSEDDMIVSGYKYEGVVVPDVEALTGNKGVAFRDNGFAIYSGGQVPVERKVVKTEKEIVSTFFDDNTIGLIHTNNSLSSQYTMDVYSGDGRFKHSKDFNIPYTTVKMSDGYILMYNSAQLCIINERGKQRYMGTVDGTLRDITKIGFNKYVLVLDSGVQLIRFK